MRLHIFHHRRLHQHRTQDVTMLIANLFSHIDDHLDGWAMLPEADIGRRHLALFVDALRIREDGT